MNIIYISGIDGCGKTTQSKMLVEWLQQRGYSAEYQWLRWEPSVLPFIQGFRRILARGQDSDTAVTKDIKTTENDVHGKWRHFKSRLMSSSVFKRIWMSYATRNYYTAYRKACHHWNSEYIVLDRYMMDFVVDQSLNFEMSPDKFCEETESSALANLQKPNVSIYISLPAEIGYQRKLDGTSLKYLKEREKLYNGFSGDNILQVDGEKSVDEIHQCITTWLDQQLVKNND